MNKLIIATASLFLFALLAQPQFALATDTATSPLQFSCEVQVQAPKSVRAAFEEYYECVEPILSAWLHEHPEEVAGLAHTHERWLASQGDDLRGRRTAARWTRRHPVRFTNRAVSLTAAQVENLAPRQGGDPVRVAGAFERLFVDRDNDRLFLTTRDEGLVSINIAERYAFTLEGKVGQAGARDFFIYDENTAFVEEPGQVGGNRDLVVLDISDPSTPREVNRLHGAIPEVSHTRRFRDDMIKAPPTFDQYRLIKEGRFLTSCGAPPTVSTHPGFHCRPDGTCYRHLTRDNADEGVCTPQLRSAPVPEGLGRVETGFGRGASAGIGSAGLSSSSPSSAARGGSAQPAPEGGRGGAGSLSQMMVYGKTLYVLSGATSGDHGWLTTFDLTRHDDPKLRHIIGLNNGPEALQRHDNLLLIAGRSAVVTVSLGEPNRPRLLGEFRQECPVNYDPIVVQGTIGYRTIITQNNRRGCTSRLEVIDLSKPHQPTLRTTVPLQRPRGLAVLGARLFIADEHRGVRVFDISDPISPEDIGFWSLPHVKDLVLSDFDLYAMTPNEIETFFVAPLFERGVPPTEAHSQIERQVTVVNTSRVVPNASSNTGNSPVINPGRLEVTGELSPEIIRRVVRQHRRELQHCYQHALQHHPGLAGHATIRFAIAATGAVVSATISDSSLNQPGMERCMTERIRRWRFPDPRSPEIVTVSYAFDFWP